MTVFVSPTALGHVDAAAIRLDRQRAGYGDTLNDLFAAAVSAIRLAPRQFPRAEDGAEFREAFIARFEYRVVFAVRDADTVEVVAVVHARRKPGSWSRHLPSSN